MPSARERYKANHRQERVQSKKFHRCADGLFQSIFPPLSDSESLAEKEHLEAVLDRIVMIDPLLHKLFDGPNLNNSAMSSNRVLKVARRRIALRSRGQHSDNTLYDGV